MFKELIGPAATYEQLAEECDELAKAAMKVARIIRGENPTPMTMEEAEQNLIEEFTDVCLVAEDLDLRVDGMIRYRKLTRWRDRIQRARYGKEEN